MLPASTAQILCERKKSALAEWIFPNPLKSEQPADPGSAYRRLKVLLKQAGLPSIRFHDLRHTYAVMAIQSGDDIKTVQENLGHATAAFTLDVYGHVTAQMKKASADRMEKKIQAVSGL